MTRSPTNDTHPDALRVQIELLRNATPARRIQLMRSLSRTVIELSRRALREADPGAGDTEIGLRFIELCYGAELAARVRRALLVRSAGSG